MPTNDDSAPPPRPSRRTLGRGPGAAPPDGGPDRPSERPTAPLTPQTASQRPAAPPSEPTSSPAPGEPQKGAQAAREATAGPSASAASAAGEAAPGTAEASAAPEPLLATTGPAAPSPTAGDVEEEPRAGRDPGTQPHTTPPARTAAREEQAVPRGETAGRTTTAGADGPAVRGAEGVPGRSPDTTDSGQAVEGRAAPASAPPAHTGRRAGVGPAPAPAARRGAGGGEGASTGEPEPVHARADLDVAPSGGGHGGDAAGAGSEASGGSDTGGGTGRGEARGGEAQADDGGNRFTVRLHNFEGPFDLLLQLISKHKLDVTEVALSKVTDEFMVYIRAMGPDWDLDQTTEFLVVAATLLDLKAARLLPAAEVEDEADLALLEARDLLFARLLQYRAYKQIADIFNDRLIAESARYPRTVGLEPHHAALLPDVVISIGPEGFAKLAVKAMQAKPKPQVYIDHIHAPLVSVREQAEVMVARLRALGEATFSTLAEDAPDVLTVVARFLALLELYRERAVLLDQPEALGSLMVRWTGEAGREPLVTDEFDQEAQAKPKPQAEAQAKPPEETATPEPEPEKEKEKEEVPS